MNHLCTSHDLPDPQHLSLPSISISILSQKAFAMFLSFWWIMQHCYQQFTWITNAGVVQYCRVSSYLIKGWLVKMILLWHDAINYTVWHSTIMSQTLINNCWTTAKTLATKLFCIFVSFPTWSKMLKIFDKRSSTLVIVIIWFGHQHQQLNLLCHTCCRGTLWSPQIIRHPQILLIIRAFSKIPCPEIFYSACVIDKSSG